MTSSLYDITPIRDALEGGHWVLTPNQRLRNRIREAFAASQGAVCLTPRVYALNEWLDACWQELQDRAVPGCEAAVINDLQARKLWKSVIEASELGAALPASNRLIQQASEALRNLALWRIPLSRLTGFGDAKEYPLLDWGERFGQQLHRLNLITREDSYRKILEAFEAGILPRINTIYLESLPDLPPLTRAVLEAAAARVLPTPQKKFGTSRINRVALDSADAEIRAAALWAHHAHNEGAQSVGIIVPDLGTSRDRVERVFTEVFEPQYYAPAEARYTLPFNISTGTPLGATPLVNTALILLKSFEEESSGDQLRKILNSPFWSDYGSEQAIRSAALDALRRQARFYYSPTQLRVTLQSLAQQHGWESSLALSRRLQQAGSEWRRGGRAMAGAWVDRILSALDLLGWPGTRSLDSVEYQQTRQWYQLLETFASLDVLEEAMTAREALSVLQQLANSTPFQAEVKHSPIQILGSLEGEGLRFDCCWVMGMSHQNWPPSPNPNPLLPLPLQRAEQMPRSSVDKEIAFAESLTRHYRNCADQVVFSHPSQQDEAHLLPSALIADLPPATAADLVDTGKLTTLGLPGYYEATRRSQALEVVDCCHGPAVKLAEGETARGGSAVLQQQALCPFNAFALFRLAARQADNPSLGLSPAQKGSAVHAVLAAIWSQLGDQQTLLTNSAQLPALVARATDQVFSDLSRDAGLELGPYYVDLEKKRVADLVLNFLTFETRREPFQVVATEQDLEGQFAGLNFRMRIDRVDRSHSGHYLIIDYKTGMSASISQWLGDRPDEPQLPLYALCYPEPVSGIAFGCVRAEKPGYCGIVDEALAPWDSQVKTPPKLSKDHQREDWASLHSEFRQRLTVLAKEYLSGYAAVQPKNLNTAIRYSEQLLPLNRLPEAGFLEYYISRRSGENHS
ncbi:PD-(D/E)XK nuclease family protein [Gilvimarinus sp. F26214L]|uniref:PD-(D/E)XK nuclease family protein n=1 Tax=Gilvimarinus sp. DZF01 TaxID=3461371 RepID=UPI004046735D